CARQDSNSDSW
nr:immunoglobulin heavy chain junction region [Macaca mulatta]